MTIAVTALGALLAAAPASAVVRHASPTGVNSVSSCTAVELPCTLKRAVETVAVNGDEVVLEPGTYSISSPVIVNDKLLNIHGATGAPPPRVISSVAFALRFQDDGSSGSRAADMQLEAPGSVVSTVPASIQSVLERLTVIAGAAGSGTAVLVSGGWTLRDSVVHTTATNGEAVFGSFGVVRLVNVTAIASDPGGVGVRATATSGGICIPPFSIELHAANVIARGGLYDVSILHQCSGTQTLVIGHSNYRSGKVQQTAPSARVEDQGDNQHASEPLFAAPASLDFHQLAGSPTIDSGAAVPALGSKDIDGDVRTLGGAPDIGADEYPPPAPGPGTGGTGGTGETGGTGGPSADARAPVASLLSVVASRRRRAGARVSYALDEAATTTFRVQRAVRRRKRTRYVTLGGSFSHSGVVGGNSFRFRGRLDGRRLRRGRYRLVARPRDAAGNTGKPVRASFIVR